MRLQNLILAAALFASAAADRARADNFYYAGVNNSGTWNLGTIDSTGGTTSIATGLSFGNAATEKLMFAPNGTLYGFDVGSMGPDAGAWGTINPSTGAFTQIGSLAYSSSSSSLTDPGSGGFAEMNGCSLGFGPSGTLYATGYSPVYGMSFGTLNLTTGAFTKISASPVSWAGSLAAWGNNFYYAGVNNSGTWNFGTINSSGVTTSIATGLSFGKATTEKLMFAPDGILYGFDVGGVGPDAGAWGTINPSTGAFTQIGSLAYSSSSSSLTDPGSGGFAEMNGCSLGFGPSGTLYATGYSPVYGMSFGTLNLTTGAFTKISASPVSWAGSLAAPVPEPSAIVLLGIGAVSLLGYAWRRRGRTA